MKYTNKIGLLAIICLILALMLLCSFVVIAEKEGVVYLFKASLGEELQLEEVLFESLKNEGMNFKLSYEFLHTKVPDEKGWEMDLSNQDGFLGVVIQDSTNSDELNREDNNFLVISTENVITPNFEKERKTKLSLTGFSLKGEDYELLVGPSSAFSWDSEGWLSRDFK